MDKELIKLLPQKAFKLLSIKEIFKIGEKITKSRFDKKSYDIQFNSLLKSWTFQDIRIVSEFKPSKITVSSKEDGEKILKIYFAQFFEKDISVHIDLRESSFSSKESFYWIPSRFHYQFQNSFREGVCSLYKGFYLKNLQESFNSIFTYFLKEDIPLNPEFAVLGINLVTLYLTLQDIPFELNVRDVFIEVYEKYQ